MSNIYPSVSDYKARSQSFLIINNANARDGSLVDRNASLIDFLSFQPYKSAAGLIEDDLAVFVDEAAQSGELGCHLWDPHGLVFHYEVVRACLRFYFLHQYVLLANLYFYVIAEELQTCLLN